MSHVTAAGKHLVAYDSSNNYINGCYPPSQAQMGQVWYDSGQQKLVVWDGAMWVSMESTTNIDMEIDAIDAIDWAIRRLNEERKIEELSDKYPMVADALRELETILKLHQNLDNGK